jgi:hypothetical protein
MNLDTGEPLEELAPVTKEWCRRHGCKANTVKDVLTGSNEQVAQTVTTYLQKFTKYEV